jgi:hypothetical protein
MWRDAYFLIIQRGDGQWFRSKIVRAIIEKNSELNCDLNHIRFLYELDGDRIDDISTYSQILDFIDRDNLDIDNDTEQLYRFHQINAQQGPL